MKHHGQNPKANREDIVRACDKVEERQTKRKRRGSPSKATYRRRKKYK